MNACTVLLRSAYAFFGMCCPVASAKAKPRRPSLQAQVRWLGMLFGELQDELLFAILAFCMCICMKDSGGADARAIPTRGRYPGRILDILYYDVSAVELMRQLDEDSAATAEEFDRETLLLRSYECAAVTLSRVNRKLRNAITDQFNERTRLVKLHADGVCSWTAGVDLDAVRRLMEYAVGSVVVLGGAVNLSMDDAKRLYRVLAQRWDVCIADAAQCRHAAQLGIAFPPGGNMMAYLPEGSFEVWIPDGAEFERSLWRVWNGSRKWRTHMLRAPCNICDDPECDRRVGMRHVFPVDFAERINPEDWMTAFVRRGRLDDRFRVDRAYRRLSPTDRAAFFEHVLLADFRLAPEQVAALTTRGTTVQTNVVVAGLDRYADVQSADGEKVPALLRTELSCCFRLKSSEAPVVVGDRVACTCDMSWKLVGEHGVSVEAPDNRPEVFVREQVNVLAVAGDFPDFHRGGFGDSWQRRILQKRNAGAALRFTALFGVCPISMDEHIE